MQKSSLMSNPFALMMEPEAVLQALEAVQRECQIKGRIYRPLDKPTEPHTPEEARRFARRQAAGFAD